MSRLHHVELRPRSLKYYTTERLQGFAESRRDAVIVDAKTGHRFKLDTKRMDTPSGGRWPMSALPPKANMVHLQETEVQLGRKLAQVRQVRTLHPRWGRHVVSPARPRFASVTSPSPG